MSVRDDEPIVILDEREEMPPAPRPEVSPPAEQAPERPGMKHHLDVLRRRKKEFAAVFLWVLAAAAIFTALQPPTYRAAATLLVEPRAFNAANVRDVYESMPVGTTLLDLYRTELEILRSRRLAEQVAKKLDVEHRPEWKDAKNPLEAFMDTIKVELLKDSRLMKVSTTAGDAEFAARAANALANQFIDDGNRRASSVNESGLANLRDAERTLRVRRMTAARTLQDFKDKNGVVSFDEQQSTAAQRLHVLADEISRAQGEQAAAAGELASYEALVKQENGAVTLAYVPDPTGVFGALAQERAKAELEREDLRARFGPDHPEMRAVEARIARTTTMRDEQARERIAAARQRLDAANARVGGLMASAKELEHAISSLARKGIEMQALKTEAERTASAYGALTERIAQVEIALATTAGTREANVFLVDPATPPVKPLRPDPLLNLVLALIVGSSLGVGVCFLLERTSGLVGDGRDIERVLGAEALGVIPRITIEQSIFGRRKLYGPELVAASEPGAAVAESFRAIRTRLNFMIPTFIHNVLLVTSAEPGAGKTTAAVNLAIAAARAGKRVLLVDANLRAPRLHELFGADPQGLGLTTAIGKGPRRAPFAGVIKTDVTGLEVMGAGPVFENPAEVLVEDAAEEWVERAREAYDLVVIDGPILAGIADAASLLAHVGHALIVARAHSTPRAALEQAREMFDRTPAMLAGVLVNMVDAPDGGWDALRALRRAEAARDRRARVERRAPPRIHQPPPALPPRHAAAA